MTHANSGLSAVIDMARRPRRYRPRMPGFHILPLGWDHARIHSLMEEFGYERESRQSSLLVAALFSASVAIIGFNSYSLWHTTYPRATWIGVGILSAMTAVPWVFAWRTKDMSAGVKVDHIAAR